MPPQTYTVALTSKKDVARNTVEFSFERPEGFAYEPGQHIEIILIDPFEMDDKGKKRDLSLVSAPYENELTIVARIRESAFKKVLNALLPGAKVEMRGPLGRSFRLHMDTTLPAVFFAGGIGISPFMSMIRHILHNGLPYTIYLFYSNRRPEDSAYHDELSKYASSFPQFKYIPTMTNMKQSTEKWTGQEGRISKELIEKYLDVIYASVFYVAGPPSMVVGMDMLLHDMGVSQDAIRTEEFIGY